MSVRVDDGTEKLQLFRMTELASGQVVIDGIDVAKIGLDDLRRKLCVLPQTSMVLRGSIRDNLGASRERHRDR